MINMDLPKPGNDKRDIFENGLMSNEVFTSYQDLGITSPAGADNAIREKYFTGRYEVLKMSGITPSSRVGEVVSPAGTTNILDVGVKELPNIQYRYYLKKI